MSPWRFLLIVSTVLVLRTGERIVVEGPVREDEGRVIFRTPGGPLYSLAAAEIDEEATLAAATAQKPADDRMKIKVTPAERERLIKELEKNHSGQAPAEQPSAVPAPPPLPVPATPGPRDVEDEWSWRSRARAHEEAIRQAQENLDLLHEKLSQLEREIVSLISLGYQPRSFTYQTTQLYRTREQIPHAELEVRRAQRAWDEFRDEARRRGILPGWLR